MGNWNDGGLPNGSRKVKFYPAGASDASGCTTWTGTTKGVYILENFNPDQPQAVQERRDEAGNPNGQLGIDGFKTAPATVQLTNAASDLINTGDGFTTKRHDAAQTVESWVVSQAGEPESQGEIRKQPITLRKLVATPSGNIPPAYP